MLGWTVLPLNLEIILRLLLSRRWLFTIFLLMFLLFLLLWLISVFRIIRIRKGPFVDEVILATLQTTTDRVTIVSVDEDIVKVVNL